MSKPPKIPVAIRPKGGATVASRAANRKRAAKYRKAHDAWMKKTYGIR